MTGYYVVEPCATANGIEIRLERKKILLGKAGKSLEGVAEVMGSSPVVLLIKMRGLPVSIYGSGRMMVKGVRRTETKKVESIARDLIAALEKGGAIE